MAGETMAAKKRRLLLAVCAKAPQWTADKIIAEAEQMMKEPEISADDWRWMREVFLPNIIRLLAEHGHG